MPDPKHGQAGATATGADVGLVVGRRGNHGGGRATGGFSVTGGASQLHGRGLRSRSLGPRRDAGSPAVAAGAGSVSGTENSGASTDGADPSLQASYCGGGTSQTREAGASSDSLLAGVPAADHGVCNDANTRGDAEPFDLEGELAQIIGSAPMASDGVIPYAHKRSHMDDRPVPGKRRRGVSSSAALPAQPLRRQPFARSTRSPNTLRPKRIGILASSSRQEEAHVVPESLAGIPTYEPPGYDSGSENLRGAAGRQEWRPPTLTRAKRPHVADSANPSSPSLLLGGRRRTG